MLWIQIQSFEHWWLHFLVVFEHFHWILFANVEFLSNLASSAWLWSFGFGYSVDSFGLFKQHWCDGVSWLVCSGLAGCHKAGTLANSPRLFLAFLSSTKQWLLGCDVLVGLGEVVNMSAALWAIEAKVMNLQFTSMCETLRFDNLIHKLIVFGCTFIKIVVFRLGSLVVWYDKLLFKVLMVAERWCFHVSCDSLLGFWSMDQWWAGLGLLEGLSSWCFGSYLSLSVSFSWKISHQFWRRSLSHD